MISCQTLTEFRGLFLPPGFSQRTQNKKDEFFFFLSSFQPAEGLGGGRVVQGSTACLVRLVDLSASAHQGHSALVPPISSCIVQRCPTMQGRVISQNNERFKYQRIKETSIKDDGETHLPIMSLLFKSVPLLKSKFRHSTFLRRGKKKMITGL